MFIYYPIKIVFTVRRVYKKCYIIKIKSFVYYCTNERNLRMKVLNKSYFSNLSINKSGYLYMLFGIAVDYRTQCQQHIEKCAVTWYR